MTTRIFQTLHPVLADLAQRLAHTADQVHEWFGRHWFRLLVLTVFTWVLLQKDLTVQVNLGAASLKAAEVPRLASPPPADRPDKSAKSAESVALPAASASDRAAYISRFAKVAQAEMRQYGIPASITLAQGLLETQAGKSPLATLHNNHFGIKCFRKDCGKGHCANFSDDSHKDFFRRYDTAWESFRGHSLLLRAERYRPLFSLDKKDYKGWAHGLARQGYATDPQYADKLIRLIESLQLYRFDQ